MQFLKAKYNWKHDWDQAFTSTWSKYGVFSGPNAGKYGPEKTPYLDTFHVVTIGAWYSTEKKYLKTSTIGLCFRVITGC